MAAWPVFAGCVAAFVVWGINGLPGRRGREIQAFTGSCGVVPFGRQGEGKRRAARPCARVIRCGCGVFNGVYRPVKWRCLRPAPKGQKRG